MIESEFHFLCICPIYRELRLKYNIRLSFNTLKYFETIMSTKSVKRIRKVSKFIYFAMLKRKEIIDSSVASQLSKFLHIINIVFFCATFSYLFCVFLCVCVFFKINIIYRDYLYAMIQPIFISLCICIYHMIYFAKSM